MPTTSDEVLIGRIAKSDRLAMEELYGRYRVPVYRFVLRMVRNPTIAEDLNSDVFLDVWRQAETFEGRSAVSTWIFSIARFKALNALQRRPTEELDDETADAIEDQADDPEVALAFSSSSSSVGRRCSALSALKRAMLKSHVETAERPSNVPACRQTSRNTSLFKSSAVAALRTMRSTKR